MKESIPFTSFSCFSVNFLGFSSPLLDPCLLSPNAIGRKGREWRVVGKGEGSVHKKVPFPNDLNKGIKKIFLVIFHSMFLEKRNNLFLIGNDSVMPFLILNIPYKIWHRIV